MQGFVHNEPMTTPDSAPKPRRGRPPRGSEVLSRERVLEAALALVDEEGVEAISMRKIAGRLGVDPMSLYNHVDGKDAILDGIAEILMSSVVVPPLGDDLRDNVETLARNFRVAMLMHPRAAPLVLTRQSGALSALTPIDVSVAAALRVGLGAQESVHLVRSVLAFLIGTLLREVESAPTFSASVEGSRRRLDELRESGLPALVETAEYLAVIDHEAVFEFGLALMLDSILGKRPA